MKNYFLILITIGLIINVKTVAQENEKKFGIKISGFVKSDFFFDSRQTIDAREGHFLLWPAAELLDENGIDLNAKSSFNFLSIQSRIKLSITGPDALGAKTSAVIEGDFFAQANTNINLFRLRHAFIKLNWENTELLAGQYWNPFFVTGCFPGTVSFNTGTPLQSFARNPQIRVTHGKGNLKFMLAALAQRDFRSMGPIGPSSSYLRNSVVPDMHFQLHYNIKNETSNSNIFLGAGMSYKTIVPRLSAVVDGLTYKVNEKVKGLSVLAFTKLTFKPVTIKLQGRYGENISDLLSVSGYAEKNLEMTTTGQCAFTPLTNATFWGEIHSNGKKVQVGLFGGYLKNLGTKKEMSSASNPVFGFGTNISSLYRVSPRVILTFDKLKIAGELEYTSTAFGSDYDVNYIPEITNTVSNTRLLLSFIYSF